MVMEKCTGMMEHLIKDNGETAYRMVKDRW